MNATLERSNVEIKEFNEGKTLEIQLSGKLSAEDYNQLAPVIERAVQKIGKVRMLVEMHDFHGWTVGALWQDIRFDARHFSHIERLALVGETDWQRRMATVCKPFTRAEVRYFDHTAIDEARRWLAGE